MAEQFMAKANGRGRLHTVALRPFVPFGPGDLVRVVCRAPPLRPLSLVRVRTRR